MDDIDDKDLAEHLREELSNTAREGLIRFCMGQQQHIALLNQLLQSKPEGKILTQKLLENGYVKFGVEDYKEK
tara:strand:- start:2752 stop:2970 length:219 start_codon:yes stop_codon:yes gene_type:complete